MTANLWTCPRCGRTFDAGADEAGDENVVRRRIAHPCRAAERQAVAQLGELLDYCRQADTISGAQLVAVLPGGRRHRVDAVEWEATLQHPAGRLLLHLDDTVHYSDPVDGCAAWWWDSDEHNWRRHDERFWSCWCSAPLKTGYTGRRHARALLAHDLACLAQDGQPVGPGVVDPVRRVPDHLDDGKPS